MAQLCGSSTAPGNWLQMPPHSVPTAHLQRIMSPSGSVTAKGMVWLHPSCKRITGAVIARGDELILPVSFLVTKENVVDIFQLLLKGEIQAAPVNPIVTMSLAVPEKSSVKRPSPNDQFSSILKSVHMYGKFLIIPEQPY